MQKNTTKPSLQRSAIMRSVKSRDNKLELVIRNFLKAKRFKYEIYATLPGKPDIILPSRKIAIRIMGCFWHGHHCKRGRRIPKINVVYWRNKISNNKLRDYRTKKELIKLKWRVIDIWECHIKKANFYTTFLKKNKTFVIWFMIKINICQSSF